MITNTHIPILVVEQQLNESLLDVLDFGLDFDGAVGLVSMHMVVYILHIEVGLLLILDEDGLVVLDDALVDGPLHEQS